MRKYWGYKFWSESLYSVVICRSGAPITESCEHEFQYGSLLGFGRNPEFSDRNIFEDMNAFTRIQEGFCRSRCGKI